MIRKTPIGKKALAAHKKVNGKIGIINKAPLKSAEDLYIWYTPGVGAVSAHLAEFPEETKDFTMKRNAVAVISDGSAVLGLGNIGPEGAIPVLEGKAMIFKRFAGIDAFPIALATQDTDEIVRTIKNIAPVFGGINLEDISAPRCFEIEERLQKELDIPVMHDDQHGTAIVVLAGLLNAFKVAKKNIKKSRIVVVGAGPAGVAVAKLLVSYGIADITVTDSKGIVSKDRHGMEAYKKNLAAITNVRGIFGTVSDALVSADAVVGVSRPGALQAKDIASMNKNAIVFVLANPIPEIMPQDALCAGALVVASGRSDFPNQVNNALVYPGVFRGALSNGVKQITTEMKIKAAESLAALVERPAANRIIPSVFDKRIVPAIAKAIR